MENLWEGGAEMARLILADKFSAVRQLLRLVLLEDQHEVVLETACGQDALNGCRNLRPDVLITELLLEGPDGLELIKHTRSDTPAVRILVFTASENRSFILRALQFKPHAFVHKTDSIACLRQAIHAVEAGCTYLASFATRLLEQEKPDSGIRLNAREMEILEMIGTGLRNKEMADRLGLSVKSVEHWRRELMRKFGVHDVSNLTRGAIRHGLLHLES